MRKCTLTAFLMATVLVMSCVDDGRERNKELATNDLEKYRTEGNALTARAQSTLMANVSAAISEGGPSYAVEFCNLKASGIMDSLSLNDGVTISRVTNRMRNAENKLKTEEDRRAWSYWTGKEAGEGAGDTVLTDRAGAPYYYKPIRIMSEACLQCHGSRSTEIAMETLEVLDEKYPADAAVNYRLGDLRGLWKVSWPQSTEN